MRKIIEIPISDVTIPAGRRPTTDEAVASLAKSIATVGLLYPILVNADNKLIAGRHRLDACKSLKWKVIPAEVVNLPELQAELAELDENLERSAYTGLEYGQALRRRKAIYEALHPETQHGGDRKSSGQVGHLKSFAEETAAKTGAAASTIRHDIAMAEALDPKAAETIADTPTADNKAELKRLGKLPPKEQRKAAKKIAAGKAATVAEAVEDDVPPEPSKGLLDAKKRPVPNDLRPAFESVGEFKTIGREMTAILKRIETLANGPAGAFLEYGLIRTDVENIKSAVKFGAPYIVCTYCKGNGDGCKPCRGSGYLNQTVTTRNEEDAA